MKRANQILVAMAAVTMIVMGLLTIKTCIDLRNLEWSVQQLEQRLLAGIQADREHQASINLALAREIDRTNARIWKVAQSMPLSDLSGSSAGRRSATTGTPTYTSAQCNAPYRN